MSILLFAYVVSQILKIALDSVQVTVVAAAVPELWPSNSAASSRASKALTWASWGPVS